MRSALALKLLVFAPSGAVAAGLRTPAVSLLAHVAYGALVGGFVSLA